MVSIALTKEQMEQLVELEKEVQEKNNHDRMLQVQESIDVQKKVVELVQELFKEIHSMSTVSEKEQVDDPGEQTYLLYRTIFISLYVQSILNGTGLSLNECADLAEKVINYFSINRDSLIKKYNNFIV